MTEKPSFSAKTFDQQLEVAGEDVTARDISPNRLLAGEVVFEPVLNGVRVTARDAHHRTLWGFIASKGMLNQPYCPVAVYETLQEILAEELIKHHLPADEAQEPLVRANRALDALEETLARLRALITVKKTSDATEARARAIARLALDANTMVSFEISSL